ncbi:beta-ketoacyl synthase N-terminal-like domain-containing protein [Sphingomonas sp. PB1R3]|uniref:beta-ketoacyl synthase N-terminal-like domain-containing protein n=1 Tax=Sphingomonas flavida TaxID=3096154 RepID=UPI002FC82D62
MTRRVVFTGMGAISGLGNDFETNWRRALNGESAIREIESDMGNIADGTGMTGVAAWIEKAVVEAAMPERNLRHLGRLDSFSSFAVIAADEAVRHAGLEDGSWRSDRTAVIIGCGSNGNATLDLALE